MLIRWHWPNLCCIGHLQKLQHPYQLDFSEENRGDNNLPAPKSDIKTTPKIFTYVGPENDALVQMIFFFRGWYSQVPAANLPGCRVRFFYSVVPFFPLSRAWWKDVVVWSCLIKLEETQKGGSIRTVILRDDILPNYIGIIKGQYKDPIN